MATPESTRSSYSLTECPDGADLRSVTATPDVIDGRPALRVQLTDEIAANGQPDVDYVDMPTFVVIPAEFTVGSIEVDILARLTPTAPDYARAFAGIAYHVINGGEHFEAVYLRPLNGRTLDPPAPRHRRAVQYFAYPDWKYQRLRDQYPDGVFESGADIRPDRWTHLELQISESAVDICIDGVAALTITELKAPARTGSVGLFVDIGTEAYFSNLVIASA